MSDPRRGRAAVVHPQRRGTRGLSIGPDGRRVYGLGDFNADIAYADLRPGANEVVITATDGGGSVARSTVVLQYQPVTPSLPYSTNWAKAGRIADQAQVVDGRWGLDEWTVRPLEMGYDRLLMVGDVSWHDYEVTVPITVHGLGPGNGSLRSGNSLVGLALNWNGHSQVQDEQPPRPGTRRALAWHRWFEPGGQVGAQRGNEDDPIVRHTRTTLDFDSTYVCAQARSEHRRRRWIPGRCGVRCTRAGAVGPHGAGGQRAADRVGRRHRAPHRYPVRRHLGHPDRGLTPATWGGAPG